MEGFVWRLAFTASLQFDLSMSLWRPRLNWLNLQNRFHHRRQRTSKFQRPLPGLAQRGSFVQSHFNGGVGCLRVLVQDRWLPISLDTLFFCGPWASDVRGSWIFRSSKSNRLPDNVTVFGNDARDHPFGTAIFFFRGEWRPRMHAALAHNILTASIMKKPLACAASLCSEFASRLGHF